MVRQARAATILAAGFFPAGTVFLRRLRGLFIIGHGTRRVHLAGIAARPTGEWVTQQARNLLMTLGDHADGLKVPIRDRDRGTKFTTAFDAVFAAVGVRIIKTPVQAPGANAIAERWISSARRGCLDRMLITGGRHLRLVLREYAGHYNVHRPHRTRCQRPPAGRERPPAMSPNARVVRRDRLGGLIHQHAQAKGEVMPSLEARRSRTPERSTRRSGRPSWPQVGTAVVECVALAVAVPPTERSPG
jgi:putative transposase